MSKQPRLVRVYWTDAHNTTSGWETQSELEEFVADNNWKCSNVGWLAYEDDECVAVASRSTFTHDQWGLIERIPRKMIEKIVDLEEQKMDNRCTFPGCNKKGFPYCPQHDAP